MNRRTTAAPALGAMIDRLYKLRERRITKEKETDAIKEQELALEAHLRQTFGELQLDGARGRVATASLSVVEQPKIEDWDKFIAYVFRTRSPELLQKRLSTTAVRERWDAKREVPGVGSMRLVKINLSKR